MSMCARLLQHLYTFVRRRRGGEGEQSRRRPSVIRTLTPSPGRIMPQGRIDRRQGRPAFRLRTLRRGTKSPPHGFRRDSPGSWLENQPARSRKVPEVRADGKGVWRTPGYSALQSSVLFLRHWQSCRCATGRVHSGGESWHLGIDTKKLTMLQTR